MAAILILCLPGAAAAEKRRGWQMGRITFIETRFNSLDATIPAGRPPVPSPATVRYTIAGVDRIYVLEMRKPKTATLTSNRIVKFAIEGPSGFVIDDRGKELKLNVLTTDSKSPTP